MKKDTIQFTSVILTCVATIILAWSTWWLSKSTKELVENNIEEFEVTNRPYIQILPYETEFKLEENKIIIYFKNWGKSFATNILVDYAFEGFGLLNWAGRIKYWSASPGEIITCPITISARKELSDELNKKIQKKQLKEENLGLILRWTYEWQNNTYPQNPEEAIADLLYAVDKESKTPKIHYYKSLEVVKMIDKIYEKQLTKVLKAVYVGMSKEHFSDVVGSLPEESYYRSLNEEWVNFLNWTTEEPDDLVVFHIRDGKVVEWKEQERNAR